MSHWLRKNETESLYPNLLTPIEQKVLAYILSHIEEKHYPPNAKEIAKYYGYEERVIVDKLLKLYETRVLKHFSPDRAMTLRDYTIKIIPNG